MVYKQGLIAVIKVNGKILRERDGEVQIPFDNEYSILLKNKENRRVQVGVNIDGQDVLNGHFLILEPFQELELERFVDNLSVGNRFKFIQKTQEIVDHRGDRIDDGFVTITYCFEARKPESGTVYEYHYPQRIYYPYYSYIHCGSAGVFSNADVTCNSSSTNYQANYASASVSNTAAITDINSDEGITVKGSVSNQQFHHGYIGSLENNWHTINIRLKGTKSDGTTVSAPLTTKTKLECKTCGKKNKSNHKYCVNCGTFLE